MNLRTGVDVVEIDRLAQISPQILPRFLARVYTPAEIEEAAGSFTFLAGRFAVKEAVSKVLGSGIGKLGWRQVETLRAENGEPQLILHEIARDFASQLGLTNWSLSISHTSRIVIAFVVAAGDEKNDSRGRR